MIVPKEQMPKIRGAICNIQTDVTGVNKMLPAGSDSNGVISVIMVISTLNWFARKQLNLC